MRRQTLDHDEFELLVVDNGSTDDTATVVRGARSFLPNLRYILEEVPGLHRARHAGLHSAAGDALVFTDDDTVPDPSWLKSILDAFEDEDVSMIGGPIRPLWDREPPQWLARLWSREKKIGTLSLIDLGNQVRQIDPVDVWGCNFSIRKDELLKVGGFHPDSMPAEKLHFRGDGESHVSMRLRAEGRRALYVPEASIRHRVPPERMTFEYFLRRAFAQGVSESFTDYRSRRSFRSKSSAWKNAVAHLFGSLLADRFLRLLLPTAAYLHLARGAAIRRGYAWHQSLLESDSELRAWVLRENYLDHE